MKTDMLKKLIKEAVCEAIQEELGRLKQLVSKYFNKKKDDDTITYF